jgi:hypothetical protein
LYIFCLISFPFPFLCKNDWLFLHNVYVITTSCSLLSFYPSQGHHWIFHGLLWQPSTCFLHASLTHSYPFFSEISDINLKSILSCITFLLNSFNNFSWSPSFHGYQGLNWLVLFLFICLLICSAGNWSQGLIHARKTLPLYNIPSLEVSMIWHLSLHFYLMLLVPSLIMLQTSFRSSKTLSSSSSSFLVLSSLSSMASYMKYEKKIILSSKVRRIENRYRMHSI